MGAFLAAAIVSSRFSGNTSHLDEYTQACNGMSVSNSMRDAGQVLLQIVKRLSEAPQRPGSLESAVASACEVPAERICTLVQVWENLQFTGAAKEWSESLKDAQRKVALNILDFVSPCRAREVASCLDCIAIERPAVKGSVLTLPGVLDVPPVLRRSMISCLEVALRLLSYSAPLEEATDLNQLLADKPQMQTVLTSKLWCEEDGSLKEEFRPSKKGKVTESKGKKK